MPRDKISPHWNDGSIYIFPTWLYNDYYRLWVIGKVLWRHFSGRWCWRFTYYSFRYGYTYRLAGL